jgi:dihydropyrimidinase
MSTLIKNGIILTSEGEYKADVLIQDEKIALIGADLECQADEVVDATGKYVMPGAIDNHSHFGLPFQGTTTADCTTSHAAVVGGTTTIVDFVPNRWVWV